MMYSSSLMHGGVGIFMALRGLCSFLAVIGGFLLIVWAVKHLPAQKLKEVGLWLFAVGVVGAVVLSALTFSARMEFGNSAMQEKGEKTIKHGGIMETGGWDDYR